MSVFSEKGLLGELEQLVLLSAIRLENGGEAAYAVSIRDDIHARAGLDLARTSVYVTLDRLDRKGYMSSWFGDPTPERGGKAKRLFTVTAAGRRALTTAETMIARMRDRRPARSAR